MPRYDLHINYVIIFTQSIQHTPIFPAIDPLIHSSMELHLAMCTSGAAPTAERKWILIGHIDVCLFGFILLSAQVLGLHVYWYLVSELVTYI